MRLAPTSTAGAVAEAQAAVRMNPDDVTALDKLGLAYQQSARETGDPTYYTKSGEALRRALRLAPRDLIATSGLGSLALSRHRFREALALGRRAHGISPTTARNYGVIGDALVELGRYRAGFRAFDAMASMKPDVSSYARIGHARYLLGDVPGATDALSLAADAAAGQGETEAWTHVQLSKVYFSVGRLDRAAAEARSALRAFPDYALGYDALAWAQFAQGRVRDAIDVRAGGCQPHSAAAVRGDARRSVPRDRKRKGSTQAVRADSHHRAAARRERRARPTSRLHSSTSTTGSGCPHRSRSRELPSESGRRSTVTTSWLGRSSGTGNAAKRCATRDARFGSGRSTRSRCSIAG